MDKPKRNVFVDKNTKQDETPGKRRKRKKVVGQKIFARPTKRIKKTQPRAPEPISPTRRKMLDKQKQDQMVKQNLTQDYSYTGIPGAIAEPAGVTIPASKKPKLALRGGGRAYGRNS